MITGAPHMETYHTVQYEKTLLSGKVIRRVTDYCTPNELEEMKQKASIKILRVEAARQVETIDVFF